MTLDNEDQRKLLLMVIQESMIPGAAIDLAYATRMAILNAPIVAPAPAPAPEHIPV